MTKIRVANRKTVNINGLLEHNDTEPRVESTCTYRPLYKSRNSDDYIDSQFQKPPVRVPTRSIALAGFLCLAGSILLSFGFLVITGYLDSKYADRMWPMVILGLLMFIPGSFHMRIAYHAYNGTPGYSFEDIPEFE